jgi:hypothetical protein
MRNELYTQVKTSINNVSTLMHDGLSPKGAVAREGGRIISHAQGKINRGLLAEGIALATTESDDPAKTLLSTWAEMEATITEANNARAIVASFYRLMIEAQHTASVITLPIGESRTWTAFNNWQELEQALEFEPELVEQLTNQGLSRLSVGELRRAAELLSSDQLGRYYDFLITMGRYMKSEEWVVRIGTRGVKVNSIALKQYEAVKRVRDGGEAPASDLSNGLASIVVWMVDTAQQHKRIVDTIPTRDPRTGNLSPFWVEGRVDINPEWDYYAAEEPVKVRHAHFEQVGANNNKEATVEAAVEAAHATWVEVANEWMETVEGVHAIAAGSRKPLAYRLRSGITVTELERVKEESLNGIVDREQTKQARFEAKRAGVKLSTERDAKEGWETAVKGVLNASQLAELNKLRKNAGLDRNIDDMLAAARK